MDALMLTLVLFVGVLVWRSALWYQQMNQRKLFYFIAATLSLAVFVEIKGVYLLLEWSYGAAMPMIFGLGLSPLLQLPTTGLIALWCARRFTV
jgi:hypothetical protein